MIIFGSCKKPFEKRKIATFEDLDFSYNDYFTYNYSIKFTQSDTVFIKYHWVSRYSEKKINTIYQAVINNQNRLKFDSLIRNINFQLLDTVYYQDYQDGDEYKIFFNKDHISKTIYAHSDSTPEEFKELSYWIVGLNKDLKLQRIDTNINFISSAGMLPPPPPPSRNR